MPNSKKKSVNIPKFSALQRCLIVDSSFQSRKEIIKDIKATELYEEIIEGNSIAESLDRIKSNYFDACYAGTGISYSGATKFILDAKKDTMSEDCAFIALVKSTRTPDEKIFPEAHSVIILPCTKRYFFEESVKAIISANKGIVWPGIRIGKDGSLEHIIDDEWQKLSDNEDIQLLISKGSGSALPKNFVLVPEPKAIENFCERILHTPKNRVQEIIITLIKQAEGENADPFSLYFLSAINEWRDSLDYCTAKEASLNLKKSLLEYTTTSNDLKK
ncbi:MAG TPA: hypothetical protein PKA63_07335 [Oligoflexia bacterium]|nr:hypothetical protein [Oligoflexia bacterium]HMP48462.1 hypothetical protein [Oligoflexia bacterium]